jgi:hypothetical protein
MYVRLRKTPEFLCGWNMYYSELLLDRAGKKIVWTPSSTFHDMSCTFITDTRTHLI